MSSPTISSNAIITSSEQLAELLRPKTWFDLPVEIQDMILEYCFANTRVVCIKRLAKWTSKSKLPPPLSGGFKTLALAKNYVTRDQVIRAMLKEAKIVVRCNRDINRIRKALDNTEKAQVSECIVEMEEDQEWNTPLINLCQAQRKRAIRAEAVRLALPNLRSVNLCSRYKFTFKWSCYVEDVDEEWLSTLRELTIASNGSSHVMVGEHIGLSTITLESCQRAVQDSHSQGKTWTTRPSWPKALIRALHRSHIAVTYSASLTMFCPGSRSVELVSLSLNGVETD